MAGVSRQRWFAKDKSNLVFGLGKTVKDSLVCRGREARGFACRGIVPVAITHELGAVVKGIAKGLMEAFHDITASHEDLLMAPQSVYAVLYNCTDEY